MVSLSEPLSKSGENANSKWVDGLVSSQRRADPEKSGSAAASVAIRPELTARTAETVLSRPLVDP